MIIDLRGCPGDDFRGCGCACMHVWEQPGAQTGPFHLLFWSLAKAELPVTASPLEPDQRLKDFVICLKERRLRSDKQDGTCGTDVGYLVWDRKRVGGWEFAEVWV